MEKHDHDLEAVQSGFSGSVSISAAASVDWTQYVETIIASPTIKFGSMPGIGATVTYSFMDSLPSEYVGTDDALGFQAFNDTMKDAARSAFTSWEAVANITFVETTGDDAAIRLGANSQTGSAAYAYYPSNQTGAGIDGDIFLNADLSYMLAPTAGTYGYETLLHEIGHAVGLKHPHEDSPTLASSLDSNANTVMSYNTVTTNTAPQELDEAAIKYLYGTNDGSSYSILTLQVGDAAGNTLAGSNTNDYIHGQAGADFISLGDGDDGSYAGDDNDTVFGEGGDDLIYGNRGLDYLEGGSGNDTIFGGQNAGSGTPMRDGVDTIIGGSGRDIIYGNFGGDLMTGGSGDDVIYGGQDNDTMVGGSGSDYLYGNLGDDFMTGGGGFDVFVFGSGQGNDTISDFDLTADYVAIKSGTNGITSTAQALALVSDVGGTATLDLGAGNSVTLIGLTSSDLRVIDFLIA
jgi:serralysin